MEGQGEVSVLKSDYLHERKLFSEGLGKVIQVGKRGNDGKAST